MGHSMEKVSQNCSAQGFDIKCCIRLAVSYRPVNSAHSLGVILRPLSRAWISPPVKRGFNCCECLQLCCNLQHYMLHTYSLDLSSLSAKSGLQSFSGVNWGIQMFVSYRPTWELWHTQPGPASRPSSKLWSRDSSSSQCQDQESSWADSLRSSCDLETRGKKDIGVVQAGLAGFTLECL